LRRFELATQIAALRAEDGAARKSKAFVLNEADRLLMDSPAGLATLAVLRQHTKDIEIVHPQMNFEIDLGLDSLARAECVAGLEQNLSIEFIAEEVATAQTVGELVESANSKLNGQPQRPSATAPGFQWHDELARATKELPEVVQRLKPKPGVALVAYTLLRLVYFMCWSLFRMEVKGREVLTELKPPYLICPNHQSYLDPFLICSTYPRSVLKHIFHVGASMYFNSGTMAQLARVINVVPIDPDAQLVRAMRAGAAGLGAGKILNIYPEGQRSFDGRLHDFKKGAAILAIELNIPIVPVALDGAYRIWPRKSRRLRLAKVKISFGKPIDARKLNSDEPGEVAYERVTQQLKQQIQDMIDQMGLNRN
jgi:long-chain acyl-CoA synthetase